MRIAICEDERYWREVLQAAVSAWAQCHSIEFCLDEFNDPESLIHDITSSPDFDLIFLDIAFGKAFMCGMEAAGYIRKMGSKIPIVFVTSDPLRADEGYLVDAMGYLTKPIDDKRLKHFLDKALKSKKPAKMIEFNTPKGITIIAHRDIIYAEVQGHMVHCHTHKDSIVFRSSMAKFLAQVGDDDFMQVHRAFLVAKDKIYSVKPTYPYSVSLIKNGDVAEVPLSRKFLNRVLEVYSDGVLRRI